MLRLSSWQVWSVILVCLAGVFLALPNLIDRAVLDRLPDFVPTRQLALGLDLKGGSHLLLEADLATFNRDRMNGTQDQIRTALLKEKIGYSQLTNDGEHVTVTLVNAADFDRLSPVIKQVDGDLVLTKGEGAAALVAFSKEALVARRQQVMDQSIEIIRRRIDENGTKEPTIQRQGDDRILVQLPGIQDPTKVRESFGKTAKLTFRLVDTKNSLEDALRGRIPPGSELLKMDEGSNRDKEEGGGPLLVERRIMVDGADLISAQATFDENNRPAISFKFNNAGARRFEEATRANIGRPFAIVLDGKYISAPRIQGIIPGGSGQITGNFTTESANDLARLLRAGALPAKLSIIEERTVGPDLGADSIRAGTIASVVAVGLVSLFMVLFYGLFGIFANIALFFNLALLMAALTVLGATLTLPGIAGIALTMGMAVDANVLVNERIREEMRLGKSMINAIEAGFERAYGTIIDANVTHLIAGTFLFELGSGPVKGFAVTLCFGILTSLFTTVLVSRLLVIWWLRGRPKTLPI